MRGEGGRRPPGQAAVDSLSVSPQGTFSLIIEALHTDSLDDLTTGGWLHCNPKTGQKANSGPVFFQQSDPCFIVLFLLQPVGFNTSTLHYLCVKSNYYMRNICKMLKKPNSGVKLVSVSLNGDDGQ